MSFADQQQLLFGDMLLERELGEGGMGKVYLYRSRSTGERFAVKRTKFRDWPGQRNFLLELMTWYGLPRHPNIVECRFFRTLQNDQTGESEIAIFAEYVPGCTLPNGEQHGSSLAHWIKSGKLYEGGPAKALERVLDIAIQFAWGLHAAHELGVVHQDVKPRNVLLTVPVVPLSEGKGDGPIVKVADFGLASAKPRVELGSGDPLHTARPGTIAYLSPEQDACEPLTRRTDIWSWAISILDMFTGEPNKGIGARAYRVTFKEYVEGSANDQRLPPMPQGLVNVLRKCFREDPAERWATMAEVANALRVVRQSLGMDSGIVPAPAHGTKGINHDRRTIFGVHWRHPRDWLATALNAEKKDTSEAETFLPRALSRRAQPVADLVGYEEARRILERLTTNRCKDQADALAAPAQKRR